MPIGNSGPFGLPGGGGPNLATEFALPNRLFADPPQPTPQDGQWLFASRNFDQPQPWYARRVFPAVAAAAFVGTQFFVSPQADATQLQPQIWRQQLDLVALGGNSFVSPNQAVEDIQPRIFRGFFAPAAQAAQQPPATWFARPQDDPGQIQPWFSKAIPGNLAPRMQPTWFAAPQSDPTQLAPWFVGQTIGQRVTPPTRPLWTASPQDDPTQLQPRFDRQFLTSAPQSPVTVQWFARPQEDTSQIAAQVWRQQLTSAPVVQPTRAIWTAGPQEDPTQIQPQVWKQYLLSAKPIPVQFFASPQADPTQIQPVFTTQQPPSQATQTPPNRQWTAAPQADPTQIAAYFAATGAYIPSAPTPPPVADGGFSGLGNYPQIVQHRKLRARIQREEDRLRELAAEEKRIAQEIEKARSDKAAAKNERRLARNEREQAQQKELVDEISKQLASEMQEAEDEQAIVAHLIEADGKILAEVQKLLRILKLG